MTIEVRLFATFRQGRFKKSLLQFNQPVTSEDVLNALNIKPEEVAILLVNGINSKADTPLKDGDVISLFPPVGGG